MFGLCFTETFYMTVVAMYRAYIGNLDSAVTEAGLQELLQQLELNVDSIVIKRGYGFIDCSDQANFEQAIIHLNGKCFIGFYHFTRSGQGQGGHPHLRTLLTKLVEMSTQHISLQMHYPPHWFLPKKQHISH